MGKRFSYSVGGALVRLVTDPNGTNLRQRPAISSGACCGGWLCLDILGIVFQG
jgi:hypothetical protein